MIKKLNQVIYGNSLKVLTRLASESVELCYMDPPFFCNRSFDSTKDGKTISFDDNWNNDLEKYLDFMRKILEQCHKVLKKTGSLYLHCDNHASHYLKVELDKIFDRKNFRNEIVWRRHNAHNDTKQGAKFFGRVHDVILFYTKSKNYTFNPMYAPYPEEYVKKYYKYTEPKTERKYALGDMSGPGGKAKGNPRYQFMGITRYWRFSKKTMKRLEEENRIVQRRKGTVPLQKRYFDEMNGGTILQDIWEDDAVKSVQLTKKENVGYPTQKPTRLLERIIQISSNEKDLYLDVFSGSGSGLVAAKRLQRKYIGVDNNLQAVKIARNRLRITKKLSKPRLEKPLLVKQTH